ncbi:MAG: hypothetical protein KF716_09105 [Anaerolineae bacterium]|nr:hypothetical protein [Anaerolineae bacterium]
MTNPPLTKIVPQVVAEALGKDKVVKVPESACADCQEPKTINTAMVATITNVTLRIIDVISILQRARHK